MSNKKEVEDRLKSFDKIYEADERHDNSVYTLDDVHAELSKIVLNDSVSIDVRQLFETAKNISLYSWFVYRFHQASELIVFSALEMALRERYAIENPDVPSKKYPFGLYHLLQHAKSEGWITNEGFPSLYERAKTFAKDKKRIEIIMTHDFEKEPSVAIEEPSMDEIEEALSEIDMVGAITNNANTIRNSLAHGSRTLHPNSVSTLFTTSEVINQIFSE